MEDDTLAEELQEKPLLNETQLDMLSTKSYCLIDNLLSINDLNHLRHYALQLDEQENFKLAGTGQGEGFSLHQPYRNDRIKWLERGENPTIDHSFFVLIDQLVKEMNRNFFLNLKDFESHLTIYAVGSYYKKHRDHFNQNNNRIMSFVFYLNDQWESRDGGELVIYDSNDVVLDQISPIGNRLAIFKSELQHEVRTVLKPRMSITGWMLHQKIGLEFLAP